MTRSELIKRILFLFEEKTIDICGLGTLLYFLVANELKDEKEGTPFKDSPPPAYEQDIVPLIELYLREAIPFNHFWNLLCDITIVCNSKKRTD